MYNSQEVALRIKKILKIKGISIGTLQTECGLGKNAITQLASSQEGMKSKNLYAIAEYLNVSVDYLLCRTDEICIEDEVMFLSDKEKQLILAYRQQTDIQKSVDRLLEISE
jgi:transcriptional regulator with XRE-family HTH domain